MQSYTGHAHYSTTQRYLHHKPRREDAAKLADAFGHNEPGEAPEGTNSGSNLSASEGNSEQDHMPESGRSRLSASPAGKRTFRLTCQEATPISRSAPLTYPRRC